MVLVLGSFLQFLVEEMNAVSFPSVFSCALELEDCVLLHRCGQVLAESSDQVLASGELGCLSRGRFHQLLRHPHLYVSSELNIFRAVIAW